MSQDELDKIGKSIDDYNATVSPPMSFAQTVENILQYANEQKSREPKTADTRNWAVVATDLEKVLAYVNTYLQGEK